MIKNGEYVLTFAEYKDYNIKDFIKEVIIWILLTLR